MSLLRDVGLKKSLQHRVHPKANIFRIAFCLRQQRATFQSQSYPRKSCFPAIQSLASPCRRRGMRMSPIAKRSQANGTPVRKPVTNVSGTISDDGELPSGQKTDTNWHSPGPAAFDFRSDVVTTPTQSMLASITSTTLLDDVRYRCAALIPNPTSSWRLQLPVFIYEYSLTLEHDGHKLAEDHRGY